MYLRDSYDIPEEIIQANHSPAFTTFLRSWFGDTGAVSHGELPLGFLQDLTPEELALARQLIRRNLKTKHNHVILGAAVLRDLAAAPLLREMLDREPNESRQLTIAGALWKLTKDYIYIELLNRAKAKPDGSLIAAHIHQVLWLNDDRALDFLIDLLDHRDHKARSFALGTLQRLNYGPGLPDPSCPRAQPAEYGTRRYDPAFRARMIAAVREANAEMEKFGAR